MTSTRDQMPLVAIAWVVFVGLGTSSASAGAPTLQDLMAPEVFTQPQFGMAVESATQYGDRVHITTTGAEVTCLPGGTVQFYQRIGHRRRVVALSLGRGMEGLRLTHSGPGFARIVMQRPRATIRINGDSLFLLHAHEALTVRVRSAIDTAWSDSYGSNHLVVDEWGGFGLYCSELSGDDRFSPYGDIVAEYALPADAVLGVGVCPPKPYDWERSLASNVVWHWSPEVAYPPDEVLRSWRDFGDVFLLQSAVMAWKDWNLDFIPRFGGQQFSRVRETVHGLGARFIVYTSPFYFLKDTGLEEHAFNSFDGFTGWPCVGTGTGENIDLFMAAIGRVMKEHRPDGLYFDAQYYLNPAALYVLARRSRELLGDEGILEWHSTGAMGFSRCYFPQADAYADLILRGEDQTQYYSDFRYLRFFVSGYNISNSIGVLCNNFSDGIPSTALTRDVLRANCRYHTISWWLDDPAVMKVLNDDYRPRLGADLQAFVDREVDRRQQQVVAEGRRRDAALQALRLPPDLGEPVVALDFDALPAAEAMVSAQNDSPLSAVEGALHIRALAHTYAFLRVPLAVKASGIVVKLRHGTDGGMAWGPSAFLRWPGGALLRLGTRSDGIIQIDTSEGLALKGRFDAHAWTWLRARWGPIWAIVEYSADGRHFEPLWSFRHGGAFLERTAEILVGKTSQSGKPQDFTVPGPPGECDIDFVHVYGE